jgi:uncharacterized membrane protein YedE/YeeE
VKRIETRVDRPPVSNGFPTTGNVMMNSASGLASPLQSESAMQDAWLHGLLGGVVLGVASALLLLSHGRIAGISGIVGSLFMRDTRDRAWRIAFLAGLASSGVIGLLVAPNATGAGVTSYPWLILAGLLVGFGTRLGGGCTSGHGVCGIGRLSARSIVAVATFTLAGALTTLVSAGLR